MDALIALVAVGCLLAAFWRIGWWRYFWGSLAVLLGGWELAAKLVTGHTLSQQFWVFHQQHPVSGWVAVWFVAVGGILLALHLAWKRLKR